MYFPRVCRTVGRLGVACGLDSAAGSPCAVFRSGCGDCVAPSVWAGLMRLWIVGAVAACGWDIFTSWSATRGAEVGGCCGGGGCVGVFESAEPTSSAWFGPSCGCGDDRVFVRAEVSASSKPPEDVGVVGVVGELPAGELPGYGSFGPDGSFVRFFLLKISKFGIRALTSDHRRPTSKQHLVAFIYDENVFSSPFVRWQSVPGSIKVKGGKLISASDDLMTAFWSSAWALQIQAPPITRKNL